MCSTAVYSEFRIFTSVKRRLCFLQKIVRHVINVNVHELMHTKKNRTSPFRRSCPQSCSLGLDVSVSRRSRDVFFKRLGLVSVSAKCGKVSVSVSSRTENQTSRSRTPRSRLHPCLSHAMERVRLEAAKVGHRSRSQVVADK